MTSCEMRQSLLSHVKLSWISITMYFKAIAEVLLITLEVQPQLKQSIASASECGYLRYSVQYHKQ